MVIAQTLSRGGENRRLWSDVSHFEKAGLKIFLIFIAWYRGEAHRLRE
jgi:hypothetical protein